jgi:hypothetical protein
MSARERLVRGSAAALALSPAKAKATDHVSTERVERSRRILIFEHSVRG